MSAIAETLEELSRRMELESVSLPNQLAVIGYVKLNRIEQYLSRVTDTAEEFHDVMQTMRESRNEVMRDVNIDAMTAAMDFLIYTFNWQAETAEEARP